MDKDNRKPEFDEEFDKNELEVKPFDEEDEEELDEEDVFLPSSVERKFDKKSKLATEKKAAERKERNRQEKEERRKARKKYIPLYIITGLFVIFAAVYFGFKLTEPEDDLADVKSEGNSYDYLVYYDYSSITRLDFNFNDGYSFVLRINRYLDSNGNVDIEYKIDGKEQFKFDEQKLSNLLTAVYSITSSTKVETDVEDFSPYGLDDPKAEVTYYVNNGKGETEGVTVLVGDSAPVGTGTYTMVKGANTVYVCGAADVDYLASKDYEYRDLNLVTLVDYSNILKDMVIDKHGDILEVYAPTTEEKMGMDYITTFRIVQPIQFPANGTYVNSKLMSYLEVIDAVSVVEDFPTDLKQYGLDESDDPITVSFRTEEEDDEGKIIVTDYKITLGNYTGEENYVYGKINGETTVYVIDMTQLDNIINLTYNDLMDQTIWLHNLKDVDYVEMKLDGTDYLFDVTQNEDGTFAGTLDGQEIIEANVKSLMTRILQIYLFDIYDTENTEVGDTKYSIHIYKNDGSDALMELREITNRKFAVFIDGEERGYYVTSSDIKNLMDGIARAKAGDKLDYTM